jgi:Fe-S oxidoreductase
VIHHTQLIEELVQGGRLSLRAASVDGLGFHDPCYLGRQNNISEAPRRSLQAAGVQVKELPRNRQQSFCCGAGGGQMWKEEEEGRERVSADRLREARNTGVGTLAVGCPFCMIMLNDAARQEGDDIEVRDVVEIVAERLNGR